MHKSSDGQFMAGGRRSVRAERRRGNTLVESPGLPQGRCRIATRRYTLVLGTIVGASLFPLESTAHAQAADHTAANKAVAMRVFDEIFNQKRLTAAAEIYAPDFVNHGLHRDASLAEDQAAARAEVTAFPDLHITVDRLIAEGDFVTVIWTFRGTHTAFGYGWFPPTGAKLELRGITVWRVINGSIQDEWTSFNMMSAYLQVLRHLKWFFVTAGAVLLAVLWLALRTLRGRSSRIPSSAAA